MPVPPLPLDVEACQAVVASDRWASQVERDTETGCLLWVGYRDIGGYGRIVARRTGRRSPLLVHRVAYVAATGADIPDGLLLDHLCRVRNCVEPSHLRPCTHQANMTAPGVLLFGGSSNAAKTQCPQGHPYTPENIKWRKSATSVSGRRRQCRTCWNEARRRNAAAKAVRT